MMARHKILAAVVLLVTLHLAILFAGFVAPADPVVQNRDFPFAPPTRLHSVDSRGHLHLRPFVYQWTNGRIRSTSTRNRMTASIRCNSSYPERRTGLLAWFHRAFTYLASTLRRRYFSLEPTVMGVTSSPGFSPEDRFRWQREFWRL